MRVEAVWCECTGTRSGRKSVSYTHLLIIGVINNGMDLLGVEAFYKQVVKGSIIIIAVLLDRKRSGRG